MQHITRALKKRLAQKNMTKLSIGAFLVTQAKAYITYPDACTGYIRNNILFLKVDHREDKATFFIKKQQMKKEIQQRLTDLNYVYMLKDIRLK